MTSIHTKHLFLKDVERVDRLEWIIALRWIAVIFVFFATFCASELFHLSLNTARIYPLTGVIFFYNVLFLWYTRTIKSKQYVSLELPHKSHNLAFVQGIIDISFLTILLHYSGGIENPFIFFYIFHIIIASLLLTRRAAYSQAIFSCALIAALSGMEYFSLLPHYEIGGFLTAHLYSNSLYVIAINVVFTSTILISAFIATSINERIIKKEEELKAARLQLEEANRSLQDQDRLKSEYVMVVSHDLKSPLSSIKSLINVLTGGHTGELNEKTLAVLNRMSHRIDGMLEFIYDLLNLSKIKTEKGLKKKEEVSITAIVNSAIEEVMGQAETQKISVERSVDSDIPGIVGNTGELKNIFSNLLSNAVKYNKENGKIFVTIKKGDCDIEITISDSGMGIEEEDIPHIFDEFYRSSKAKKQAIDGTGLGLSLVKCMVERHGGRISVSSSSGKGSTFIVTIPHYSPS